MTRNIIEKIGTPDSKKIESVLSRMDAADKAINCISATLRLLGANEDENKCYAPMSWLWDNGNDLVFFTGQGYERCNPVIESDLGSGLSYHSESPLGYFKINLGDIFEPWKFQKVIKINNRVTDPFYYYKSDVLWEKMNHLLDEEKVVGTLTFSDDIQAFHSSTLIKNQGGIYCVAKDQYSPLKITEININNLKNVPSYNLIGQHFIALTKN